jgi:hypothetical protein
MYLLGSVGQTDPTTTMIRGPLTSTPGSGPNFNALDLFLHLGRVTRQPL